VPFAPPRPRPKPAPPAALACALAAALVVAPAGAAHAAASSTTCTGPSHVTFSPGLTLTPQTVAYTEADSLTCTSTDTTLTSGVLPTYTASVPNASCDDVILPGSGPTYVRWNNGQYSVATLTYALTATGGTVQETGTGTITAGEYTGTTAVFAWAYLSDPLQCLAPGGLTVQNGIVTAQITGT
jgi:hypothetical protein